MRVEEEVSSILKRVLDLTMEANAWRLRRSINLIASENIMSPLALKAYLSDFMFRYAEGRPFKRYYQGTRYIDELESLAEKVMGDLLGVDMVDLRPVSGTIANAAVFRALAEPGDKAAIAPVQAGAHVSHTKFGTLGALGIKQIELPYDKENMNVDVDKSIRIIESEKPKFAVLGGSVYLFPHPVSEISNAIHSVGGKLVYDAAHVLGLIVGGVWRNPLKYGADALTASTHKTFPGPQGGVIAFSDEQLHKVVSKTIFPWFVSNHHLHRIPATLITALEMKVYGSDYAKAIVDNAKTLAQELTAYGFKVIGEHLGFTQSHQVLVDVREVGGGDYVARLLEEAHIITNKNLLPWDPPESVRNPSGIRLGTQEVTRLGMGRSEMKYIAELIYRVVIRKEDTRLIAKEVEEFRSQYTRVHYCFKDSEAERLSTILDYISS